MSCIYVKLSKTTSPYQFNWDSTTVADGAVTLTASAFDAAGNTATAMISVTVRNTPSDTTPPTVSITSPVAGSTVSGIVAVAVSAADNVGVTRVELRANTALVGTKTTSPYQFNWDSAAVANGAVTLMASAFDAAGNTASATANVNVLNPAYIAAHAIGECFEVIPGA